MRLVFALVLLTLTAPASAAACHPVPDPPPPGYSDHGCGDTTKGGVKPAAAQTVTVGDDFFAASTVQVQPGDTVTWRWDGSSEHNVRAFPHQTESFRSAFMSGTGKTFARAFAKPGRFTYFCEIHPSTMRGAVEVGPAPFPDTSLPRVTGLKARVAGSVVKLSFRLSESARVRASLSGPSRKVTTRILRKGSRSLTLRGLRDGRYRAGLRATDTAGNRGEAASKRVSVR